MLFLINSSVSGIQILDAMTLHISSGVRCFGNWLYYSNCVDLSSLGAFAKWINECEAFQFIFDVGVRRSIEKHRSQTFNLIRAFMATPTTTSIILALKWIINPFISKKNHVDSDCGVIGSTALSYWSMSIQGSWKLQRFHWHHNLFYCMAYVIMIFVHTIFLDFIQRRDLSD